MKNQEDLDDLLATYVQGYYGQDDSFREHLSEETQGVAGMYRHFLCKSKPG